MSTQQQESIEITQRNNVEIESNQDLHQENNGFLNQNNKKTPQNQLDDKKEKLEQIAQWVKTKLEALAWVSGAVFLVYYSNFFKILFDEEKRNELFFNIFMICVGINASIAIYVAIILPYILKVKEDFEKHSPKVVYVGAISGFIGFISLIIAIWPAFGWFSPPMVFVLFLGYLNTAHFLPNNQIGSLLFSLIFIGAFFSYEFINHEGYLHK